MKLKKLEDKFLCKECYPELDSGFSTKSRDEVAAFSFLIVIINSMKKYLLLALLVFVPFFANAQQVPELYITNLSIEKTNYQLGDRVSGSFTLNNNAEFDASDIHYSISLEDGFAGISSSDDIGPFFVHGSSSEIISFDYLIEEKVKDSNNLQIFIYKSDGTIIAREKINISISGENIAYPEYKLKLVEQDLFDGYEIPSVEELEELVAGITDPLELEKEAIKIQQAQFADTGFSLDSIPFVEPGKKLNIIVEDGDIEKVEVQIFERSFSGSPVDSVFAETEEVDGESTVSLPTDLDPGYYVGEISAEGYATVRFAYNILGTQASILNISSDVLSPNKGQQLKVNLLIGGWPVDVVGSDIDSRPEAVKFDLIVSNQDGELVDEFVRTVEIPETIEDNGQSFNIFELPITLQAKTSAESVLFDLTIYDAENGDILDTLQTQFASDMETEESSFILIAVSIIVLVALVGLVSVLKIKKTIPTVVITLLFTGSLFTFVSTQEVNAWWWNNTPTNNTYYKGVPSERLPWVSNGYLNVTTPKPSSVREYQPGESFTYDAVYSIIAGNSNGFLGYRVAVPDDSEWHAYTTLQDSLDGVQNYIDNHRIPTSLFNWYVKCNDEGHQISCNFLENFSNAMGIDIDDRLATSPYTESFSGYAFGTSYSISESMTMPATSGTYYLPLHITYCTASHGCADKTYVQNITVIDEDQLSCTVSPGSPRIGEDVTYTASIENPNDPNDLRYWWDDVDDVSSSDTYIENYATPGSKTVSLRAASGNEEYGPITCEANVSSGDSCTGDGPIRVCTDGTWRNPVCSIDGTWSLVDSGDPCDESDNYQISCSFDPQGRINTGDEFEIEAEITHLGTDEDEDDFDFTWTFEGSQILSGVGENVIDGLSHANEGSYEYVVNVSHVSSSLDLDEKTCFANVFDPTGSGDPVINDFSISPVISPNCRGSFEAQNSASCYIQKIDGTKVSSDFLDTDDRVEDGNISVSSTDTLDVGTYQVVCTNADGVPKASENTQRCISNPNVIEQ
jgi:hypothetical protein